MGEWIIARKGGHTLHLRGETALSKVAASHKHQQVALSLSLFVDGVMAASTRQREFLQWKLQQDRERAHLAAQRRRKFAQEAASPPHLHHKEVPFYYTGHDDDDDDDGIYADGEPSPSQRFVDDDGDTEEDELMRMIMEKEQQEADAAAVAAAMARKKQLHYQMPLRNGRTVKATAAAASVVDDFFSPMRPAGDEPQVHPFRGARVTGTSTDTQHRYGAAGKGKQGSPQYADHRQQQQQQRRYGGDAPSNQVEHEHPTAHTPKQQPRDRRRSSTKARMNDANDVWEAYISGGADETTHRPKQSLQHVQPNIFKEEISLSRSRSNSLDDLLRPLSSAASPQVSSDVNGHHDAHQERNFSNESIPDVSYSPPMSPAMNSSSRLRRSSAANRSRGLGARQQRRSEAADNSDKDNKDPDEDQDGGDQQHSDRTFTAQQVQSSTLFPFWSVAFLFGCFLVGAGGFFIEDVMNLFGKITKTAPSLTLSKEEQQYMHNRLEQLQTEIHGFRYTASEIEGHSQKVFDEVKAHLDRMKNEREKHQDLIAKEMNDLRTHMLKMMNEMVDQERELIQKRLKEAVETKVHDVDQRIHETLHETGSDKGDQTQPQGGISSGMPAGANQDTITAAARQDGAQLRSVHSAPSGDDVSTLVHKPVVGDNVVEAGAPKPAVLSTGENMMLLSWELLLMLAAMSILGGFVGLRVRNLNRRKRWYEQRKIRRQIQARLEQERADRLAEEEEEEDEVDSEEDAEDTEYEEEEGEEGDEEEEPVSNNNIAKDWEDAATESSIETVSLMRRASEDIAESYAHERSNQHASSSESDTEDDAADTPSGARRPENKSDPTQVRSSRPLSNIPRLFSFVFCQLTHTSQRYSFVKDDADLRSSRRRSPRLERRTQRRNLS